MLTWCAKDFWVSALAALVLGKTVWAKESKRVRWVLSSHDCFQHLTSLLVTEWMQPYVQRQIKWLEFNEFSKAVLSANDLHKSGECFDMNVLFHIQSRTIPKRRDQTPTSAFALIPPGLEFAERVSASSLTYAR
jgi:hypothetical protein